MVNVEEHAVRTTTVPLGSGRVLHLSRFTDAATARDVVTLAEGWPEEGPTPRARGQALDLPGGKLPDVLRALEALAEDP